MVEVKHSDHFVVEVVGFVVLVELLVVVFHKSPRERGLAASSRTFSSTKKSTKKRHT